MSGSSPNMTFMSFPRLTRESFLQKFLQRGKGLSDFPAKRLDLVAGSDAVGNHNRLKARAVDADDAVGAVFDSRAKVRLNAKLAGGL